MIVGRLPDTSTPIGCLVGFFALFPTIFFVIVFWGAYKAFGQMPTDFEIGYKLIRWGILSALPALAGLAFCIYRIATDR